MPPEMLKGIAINYSFPIDLFSLAVAARRAATFDSARSREPLPGRFSAELRDLISACFSEKAVDRPVLAELILHPLIRPHITLEPLNESRMLNHSRG